MKIPSFFPYGEDRVFSILFCIVLFVPLVFSPFTYERFETLKLALFAILTGLALILFLWEKRTFKIPPTAFGLIAVFLFLGFLATVFSPDKVYSFLGKNYLWTGYFLFLVWSAFILLLSSTLTRDKLQYLWQVVLFAGLLNALWAGIQAFGIGYYEDPKVIGYLLRPPAFLGNPSFSAMFLATIIPVAVYFCAVSRGFWQKIYYSVATFLLIFAEMLVSSRGAIIGLSLGLLAILLSGFLLKSKKLFGAGAAAGISVAIFYFLFTIPFRQGTYSPTISQENITQRIVTWSEAFRIISHHLWTGIGFGNFIGTGSYFDPHNIFINFFLTGGIPLILFCLISVCLATYASSRKIITEKNIFLAAVFAGFLAFLASASFNPVSVACWVLFALIIASIIFEISPTASHLQIKLPAAFLGIFLIGVGSMFMAAEVFLYQGRKLASVQKYEQSDKFAKVAIFFNPYSVSRWTLIENNIKQNFDILKVDEQIEKIRSQHAGDDLVQLRAGLNFYGLYAKTLDEKYFSKSIDAIQKSVAINPTVPAGHFYLAYEYFQHQEMEKALLYSKQALVANPGDKESWILMANAYLAAGRTKQAVLPAQKAFEINIEAKPLKHWVEAIKSGKTVQPYEILLPMPTWD